MGNKHQHRVLAWWNAGKAGLVKSDSLPHAIHFAAPRQFGGLEERCSPEDLLLSASRMFHDDLSSPCGLLKARIQGPQSRSSRSCPQGEIGI